MNDVTSFNRELCLRVPQCIGWSNTRRRIYVNTPIQIPGVETFVIRGKIRTSRGIFAGVPIGGICGTTAYMGTLSFFAEDSSGNHYAITDSHVVAHYNTVYFPSPVLQINPSYTVEKIPITTPTQIGTVTYRTNICQQSVDLDLAVIKLNSDIEPHVITYGNQLPLFFDVNAELEPVIKVGARTGITSGISVDRSVTLRIVNIYGNQIYFTGPLFQLYSEEGDSGGPIFVGNSIVSTIVAGTGEFALGNDVVQIVRTLSSLGLRPYFSQSKKVLYYTSIPPLIAGAVTTLLSFFLP